jgi:hypothetical protein
MSKELKPKTDPNGPLAYQIRLKGHLDREWTDWFEGLTVTLEEDGNTLLTGEAIDQAALHGLFKKMRDLGIPLISVNRIESKPVNINCSTKEQKMNTNKPTAEMRDRKVILSASWIFVTLNYLYCDVMTLMDAKFLKQFMEGKVGSIDTTQGFFLGAAILMEIPIAMVLLSRVLKHGANRWANIIAGAIMTAVQFASLVSGSSTIYYMFFSIIEIACTSLIVWYAWKWTHPEG